MSQGFSSPPTVSGPYGSPTSWAHGSTAPADTSGAVAGASTDNGSDLDGSTKEVAKQEAGNVAQGAAQAGQQVAGTVKDQAANVTAEAGKQAKQLLSQAQSELSGQAAAQQERVASGLRSVADQLHGMADGSTEPGMATDLAREAADKANQVAGWLDNRDPGAVLDEVRSFARKRPGAYLAIALGAGVLAGRLTRGLTAGSESGSEPEIPAQPGIGELATSPASQPVSQPVSLPAEGLSAMPGQLSTPQFHDVLPYQNGGERTP